MRKLLMLLPFLLLGCENEEVKPEVNVVFFSTGTYYVLNIYDFATIEVSKDEVFVYPYCETEPYEGCKFVQLKMPAGGYKAWISRPFWEGKEVDFTVKENVCNTFDVNHVNGWR
jgi:hypothetical protein